jgi:putative nucleotidyltransferase with HDIG domain
MPKEISLIASVISVIMFLSLLYLYLKNKKDSTFFYACTPFLCGAIMLLGYYQLKVAVHAPDTIFWSKFIYIGVFGYLMAIPLYLSSILRVQLGKLLVTFIYILSIGFICITFFTNLVVSNATSPYGGILRATPGILYPYFMFVFFAVSIYFYVYHIHYGQKAHNLLKNGINYIPVVIGTGVAFAGGIVDVVGIIINHPLIPWLQHPHILSVIVFSLSFLWTYLSQYSWILSALDKSEKRIDSLVAKSHRNFLEFVLLIAKTLDAKDHYTAGHSLRVMDYAVKIARELKLPAQEIEMLKYACLLHDIGKIGIPDGILNKTSELSEKEREHIINHPVLGKQILGTMSEFVEILEIIYHHHERVDGNGYPNGLKHDEIPLLARILAVADTYDAMRSERPYRQAKTKEQAIRELELAKGTQLDEQIVTTFINAFE